MAVLSLRPLGSYAAPVHEPAPTIDDDDLAQRIAAPRGDADAEAELCRRFAPRIRLYGLRHLRSTAAAADLVQDVLLMTLTKLRAGALRDSGKLASFILGTCRQRVIDGRRGGHRRERILETFPTHFADLVEESPEALDIPRLESCLARLAERERSVLIMTFYDERPAEEVGAALGISPGNVRVIRHRGIEKLRLCIDAQEGA
jgi:RNA polymerase sigma-70 factor (ECF subfamily)